MLNNSKYSKWYMRLVENAKSRTLDGYIEKHHIIPRSIGGSNDKDNIVSLTPREHLIAHLLLTKCCIASEHKKKMIFALKCMSDMNNPFQNRNRGYGIISKIAKSESGFKGKTHKPETIEQMRKIKLGKKVTEVTKQRMKQARIGKSSGMLGKQHDENTKTKFANARLGKKIYINILTGKGKMFFPGEQPIGYILKPVKKQGEIK